MISCAGPNKVDLDFMAVLIIRKFHNDILKAAIPETRSLMEFPNPQGQIVISTVSSPILPKFKLDQVCTADLITCKFYVATILDKLAMPWTG